MQAKNIEQTHALPMYTVVLSLHILFVDQTSMFLDFQMIILFFPPFGSLLIAVNLQRFVLVAPCLAVMLIAIQLPVVHKIPHILTLTVPSGFCSHLNASNL